MKKTKPIRVMIAEDHFIMRVGLAAIINSQTDMLTVAEAGNGNQAVELFCENLPDVTLMDLRMPEMNGLEAITRIKKKFPRARFIVLSTYGGGEDIFRAFQVGARAYFLKDVNGAELIKAIRLVHAGQRVLPPEIALRLAERIPRSELSRRELEILKLISKGKSNKEISRTLAISDGTVRVHASNIFAKLGCHDRAQAVSEAFQRGIIHLY
ncbi:MAG: response regulator transcription factor [Acidobacteriota bacterium]|nr:response regulator transcription factor [Acidobacteriota bacterium]